VPADLQDRRVEITGPVDRKMIINALNAPVRAFMADFEDSCSPTWENVIRGQVNLADAIRRTISHADRRPARFIGWPSVPRLSSCDPGVGICRKSTCGSMARRFPVRFSTSHCSSPTTTRRLRSGAPGPYFYLPKMESHLEARLWNDVFLAAQDALGLPRGTIKATVLIETILAAFEMDEILYELREHSAGLNCGRWDYIFSYIKKFRNRPDFLLPTARP